MTTTIWTLLSIFVIAPVGALAIDRPLFGNWIWHIGPAGRKIEETGGATGIRPFGKPATGGSLTQ
jgi:hypothetical protein